MFVHLPSCVLNKKKHVTDIPLHDSLSMSWESFKEGVGVEGRRGVEATSRGKQSEPVLCNS